MRVEWVQDSWMSSWTLMWSRSCKPSRINKVLEAPHGSWTLIWSRRCKPSRINKVLETPHGLECALSSHNNFFSLKYFSHNKTFVLNLISYVTILIGDVSKETIV